MPWTMILIAKKKWFKKRKNLRVLMKMSHSKVTSTESELKLEYDIKLCYSDLEQEKFKVTEQ